MPTDNLADSLSALCKPGYEPTRAAGPASTTAPENCFLSVGCETPADFSASFAPAAPLVVAPAAAARPTLAPAAAIPLDRALAIGARVLNELAPLSVKIEIAGSARRRRRFCNDLDFVVITRDSAAFRERVLLRCQLAKKADGSNKGDGSELLIVEMSNGVQLDFYFAHEAGGDMFKKTPCTWGSVLLCRTGSASHNIKLAKRALERGYRWQTTTGLVSAGNYICGATEEEIFQALELPFIKPEEREA